MQLIFRNLPFQFKLQILHIQEHIMVQLSSKEKPKNRPLQYSLKY